jgi:uncharacterized iron-regulated membrane protein
MKSNFKFSFPPGLRTTLFWVHLALGVSAGLVIASMAVSGILLAYEPQLVDWAEEDVRRVAAPPGAMPRSAGALVAAVRAERPEARPASVTVFADPQASAIVNLGRSSGPLFVNPYTGAVLGAESRTHRALHAIEDWHRRLATGDAGRRVTGTACAAFALLLVSGLLLWWPREWTRAALAAVSLFRPGLAGRARDFNWHNVAGLWCAPLILVTTLTGLVMSFSWANELLFEAAGSTAPPSRADRRGEKNAPPIVPENLDALVARARTEVPAWISVNVRFATEADAPITVFVEEPPLGGVRARSSLTLDPRTAAVVRAEPFASLDTGRRWRAAMTPLHTGRIAGVWGQSLALVAAAGTGLLVWTGFALAWRRLRSWRARRAARPAAAAALGSRSLIPEEEGGLP